MEIITSAVQVVGVNQNVLFTDTVTGGGCSIIHREGSGLVSLRGNTNQCRARYKVSFGGNIAIPNGQTVGPISLAISLDGEPIQSTLMISTPGIVERYNNVFGAIFIDVPKGCCVTVGIKNTSAIPIDVQNANLIAERVA